MKFKTLLAVATVAVSGAANAVLENGNDGELVFSAWDPVNQVSYTQDLGVRHNAILGEYANASYSLSFNVDPLYNTVFTSSNVNDIIWNVSSASTDFFGNYGVQFTTLDPAPAAFGNFQNLANVAAQHVQYSQALQGVNPAAGDIAYEGNTTNGAYAGSPSLWNTNWAGQGGVLNNTASIGDSMNWFFMGLSADFSTAALRDEALADWTFDGTNLNFASTVVPVPAAAWLLASGLIGLSTITRRRKTA
jgi:hypothetical protein